MDGLALEKIIKVSEKIEFWSSPRNAHVYDKGKGQIEPFSSPVAIHINKSLMHNENKPSADMIQIIGRSAKKC